MTPLANAVLLVEDNIALREALQDQLSYSGFAVRGVGDAGFVTAANHFHDGAGFEVEEFIGLQPRV